MDLINGSKCPDCASESNVRFDSFKYAPFEDDGETLMFYTYHCSKCETKWVEKVLIKYMGRDVLRHEA